jgi:hypothetical protein
MLHATHDSHAIAAKARDGLRRRFEREVDPEGELTPAERARRADLAMRAHMTRLAMASARKRARRRARADS